MRRSLRTRAIVIPGLAMLLTSQVALAKSADDLPSTEQIKKTTQERLDWYRRRSISPAPPARADEAERPASVVRGTHADVGLGSVPAGAQIWVGEHLKGITPQTVTVPLIGGEAVPLALVKESAGVRYGAIVWLGEIAPDETYEVGAVHLSAEAISDFDLPCLAALGQRKQGLDSIFGGLIRAADRDERGAEWWSSHERGFEVRLRPRGFTPEDREVKIADLVRVTSPAGGHIAGLRVGDSVEKLREVLGAPAVFDDLPDVLFYMDGGVRVAVRDGRVEAIEIARTAEQLRSGAASFIRPERPEFHLLPVIGEAPEEIRRHIEDIVGDMLQRVPTYSMRESPGSADYEVEISVVKPSVTRAWRSEERKRSKKERRGADTVYFTEVTFSCFVSLTVRDAASGRPLPAFAGRMGYAHDSVKIYRDSKYGNTTDHGDVYYARQVAVQAVRELQADLHDIASLKGRVFRIDYDRNQIYVNLGRRHGICLPKESAGREIQFGVTVDGAPLKTEHGPERCFGVVVDVGPDHCVVSLKKKVRRLFGMRWEDDWGPLVSIPDPGSGRVGAFSRTPASLLR